MMENLEEMRGQLEALNRKLEKQSIINDKLLRKAMRGRLGTIRRKYLVSIACCLYVLTAGLYSFHLLGLRDAFLVATGAMMVASLCGTLYIGGGVLTGTLLDGTMLQIAQRAAQCKRREQTWFRYSMLLVLLWTGWLCYEVLTIGQGFLLVCIVFGLVAGLAISYRMYRKIVGSYSEMISDIDELQRGL